MAKKRWGDGGVYLRGSTWWIHYSHEGRTIRESSKSDKKSVAEDLRRKRLAEIQQGQFGPMRASVGDLLDLVLRDYRLNRKSLSWAEMIIETHLRPYFQYYAASKVGTAELQKYIEKRKSEGRAHATINNELALLHRAYSLGAQCEPPMVAKVPRMPKLKAAPPRAGFFEESQYQAMLAELPDYLKPVLTFAYWTGCRRGEILKLRWDQVDLENRLIRMNPGTTKNDQSRVIPIVSDLLEVLRRQKQERDENWPMCPWVFPRYGNQIRSMKNAWGRARERAGLDEALIHDLRRTAVRNMIRAGVPEKIAMQISGHLTRSVFDRYHIVSESDLHDAARKMEIGGGGGARTPKADEPLAPKASASASSATPPEGV